MNKLYITDLDGTLLNSNAEVSIYTKNTLNELIDKGMQFSFATARTGATAVQIMRDIHVNCPVILMNGVLIYDIPNETYIKIESLSTHEAKSVLSLLKRHKLTGFVYTIENDEMNTYYEDLSVSHRKAFHDERVIKFGKKYTKVDIFEDILEQNIIYISLIETKDILQAAYDELKDIDGLRVELYKDVYNQDLWFLEVFSDRASKYKSVKFLRENYRFDKVTGFGDNFNDIPLFKACDECYAVQNAKDELKAIATSIIESNEDNGVVKWLESNFKHK